MTPPTPSPCPEPCPQCGSLNAIMDDPVHISVCGSCGFEGRKREALLASTTPNPTPKPCRNCGRATHADGSPLVNAGSLSKLACWKIVCGSCGEIYGFYETEELAVMLYNSGPDRLEAPAWAQERIVELEAALQRITSLEGPKQPLHPFLHATSIARKALAPKGL